jgi:hypothetical protein
MSSAIQHMDGTFCEAWEMPPGGSDEMIRCDQVGDDRSADQPGRFGHQHAYWQFLGRLAGK